MSHILDMPLERALNPLQRYTKRATARKLSSCQPDKRLVSTFGLRTHGIASIFFVSTTVKCALISYGAAGRSGRGSRRSAQGPVIPSRGATVMTPRQRAAALACGVARLNAPIILKVHHE